MHYKLIILLIAIMCLTCNDHSHQTVLVTGHRGASGLAPENTIAAMKKAIESGADYSELDVQETKDGVLVLLHDSSLKRTAGIDQNIWDLDYNSIKTIDVGSWKEPKVPGEPIPSLKEVMEFVRGKMKLNIEMKVNSHEEQLPERVTAMIDEMDFISECIVTSFDFDAIDTIRKINKNIKVGYLFSKIPEGVDVFSADVDLFSVRHDIVNAEFVKKAHASGKSVHVYTVNDPQEMKRLIGVGVDNIITDRPDVLNKVLNSI